MEADFWHERWREGQIGFHLGHVNPTLVRHHAAIGGGPGSRVLVPLCGKSLDLLWLAEQGHAVLGVELSPLAVQAFFAEQRLTPEIDQHGPFVRHRVRNLEILCGDVFALDRTLLGEVSGLFDRAALVAFPPSMRERYAAHITELLPKAARGLLVTFQYQPVGAGGPPFSVDESVVRELYAPSCDVALLERREMLDEEPRFKERGIRSMQECAYSLLRR